MPLNKRQLIGVDLGGTRIKVGMVQGAEVLQTTTVKTPKTVTATLEAIVKAINTLTSSPRVVGLAIPGEVDLNGRIWRLPNIPGFEGVSIATILEDRLSCPIFVENDAIAAAIAENRLGYGKTYAHFLTVTLGTGIGGGLVLDHKPRRGTHGFAGEIGHILIDNQPDAWPCNCDRKGCMEAYAGTRGLLRRFTELGGSHVSDVQAIVPSAQRNEPAGYKTFEMMGWALGTGLATLQNILDLEAFVFTGGVAAAFVDWIEAPLRKALKERTFASVLGDLPLKVSPLQPHTGLIGAAHLIVEKS